MKARDSLWVAFDALRANPMRSFLTTLGVIIGVTAVVTLVSMGEGAKSQITSQIESLGSNLLMVTPGRMEGGGAFGSGFGLTQDVLPVIAACPSVKNVSPEVGGGQEDVTFNRNSLTTSVTGTSESYPEVRSLTIASGNYFSAEDVQRARSVAVIGADVVTQLFPDMEPIGQRIKIGSSRYTIIGVLATRGQSGFLSNDDVVYIPMTTAQRRLLGNRNRRLRMIYVEAVSAEAMEQAKNEIDQALLAKLKDQNAYSIGSQADLITTVQSATGTLTALLAGIAGVSLLVGGIGIMNIMLVTVTERIKEIGLRKAIGAREGEILGQFMLEAATLSLLGGLTGIVLGTVGAAVLSRSFGWQAIISPSAVIMSFVLSLVIGLFFGVYPARKAARLDPIVALRHE